MSAGGSVLWLIAILAAFMWAIILERIWYFNAGHQIYMNELKGEWDSIDDHTTWKSQQIKDKFTKVKDWSDPNPMKAEGGSIKDYYKTYNTQRFI